MFDNTSKVNLIDYDIDLSNPIGFYCNLINDIAKISNPDFSITSLYSADFLREMGIRLDSESTVDDLASKVATFYNSTILDDIDFSVTDLYIVDKRRKILIVDGANSEVRDIKNNLNEYIKQKKIFLHLTESIQDQEIQANVKKLTKVGFDDLFKSVVTLTSKRKNWIPYIPSLYFQADSITTSEIDQKDLLINNQKLSQDFGLTFGAENEVNQIFTQNEEGEYDEIGITYKSLFFPLVNSDLGRFISADNYINYVWLMFKEVFKKPVGRGNDFETDLQKSFRVKVKEDALSNLLSNLEKNLHLPIELQNQLGEYELFFECVTQITKLEEFADLEFYVTSEQGKTSLGIYTNQKIGKKYNLLHWIKGNDNSVSQDYYRDAKAPISKSNSMKLTLKPEVAFYFLSNFFEDFLEQAILAHTSQYIKNFELYTNNSNVGEFDFLIKTPKKLCFIEAKTKLTDEYIESYIVKCSKLLRQLDSISERLNIEFYLISAFSDKTCQRKKYFIDQSPTDGGYNTRRDNLSTIPYNFQVPIPQFANRQLNCISEPNFENLKNLIEVICQE
ncbi:hypothetical protein [Pedobacter sp. R20-19]|uniref:hypothetical protein n=1 Tax=Pedobacter sp. R20-19 TaxID=1270196 RepID=UPI000562C3CD|nr:hypothetical protein [Pedobacter sp. R20-19]